MISNVNISTRIEKLTEIKSSLIKERKEYDKYHNYFESSIHSLIESNTKLLKSLKERYSHYIILMKRHDSIDISLNDQIKALKNRKEIEKIFLQLTNSKNDGSEQVLSPKEAIDATVHLARGELRDLYTRLQLIRQQHLYEEKFLKEIKELRKKKEELEDQKRLSEKEVIFFQKQFNAIADYNGCHDLLILLTKLKNSTYICQCLRQDKLDIINFHQQMKRNKNYHKKIKGINPENLLRACNISLNSDASTSSISALCESSLVENSAEKSNDQKQIDQLTTSTEMMSRESYKFNYSENSHFDSITSDGRKSRKVQKSDNSVKNSTNQSIQSQNIKPPKLDKKRLKIINEISASSQKMAKKTSKEQKKSKNEIIKRDSSKKNSKKSIVSSNDYSYESTSSTTVSDTHKSSIIKSSSAKKSSIISSNQAKKDHESESASTLNESKSAKENRQKASNKSNNSNNQQNNDDEISIDNDHKSSTGKNNEVMSDIPKKKKFENNQSETDSQLKVGLIKSSDDSLSSIFYNPDITRHRHYSHKYVPERIPVILPEKGDLFVKLLHKHHKERRIQIENDKNIQLGHTNFNISSSQAFLKEFQDSNEYGSFLRKNNELSIKEFDTFTQTDQSIRTLLASILNEKLQSFINEDKINDAIYNCHNQLDEIEIAVSGLHRELEMRKKSSDRLIKKLKIVPPEKLNRIVLNIKQEIEKVDSKSQTKEIQSLEKIRNEIIENSKLNPKSFLKKMEHRDLVAMLTKKKLELKIIKMTNVRKQLDITSLLKRLKIVDPLMYSAETHEPSTIEVDPNILEKKQSKLDKIESLNRHFRDIVTENRLLDAQIADQEYLVESITNYLAGMAKEPKYNVRALCMSLKRDRNLINEFNRQIRFVAIENESITKEISRYDDIISSRSMMIINQKVDNLNKYLIQLKTRFNTLRAVKENRSFVMTCEEEMVSLQRQINMVLSEIEVYRMRINGTISKIEKQMRGIALNNIKIPKPISNLNRNGKSKSPRKY